MARNRWLNRSIRARFTPRSSRPTREAERNRTSFALLSTTTSTSSTNRSTRLRASARRYPGRSTASRTLGSWRSADRACSCATSAGPWNGSAAIRWRRLVASVETQLGVPGQGRSASPGLEGLIGFLLLSRLGNAGIEPEPYRDCQRRQEEGEVRSPAERSEQHRGDGHQAIPQHGVLHSPCQPGAE